MLMTRGNSRTPEFLVISTSRQAAKAYRFQVFDMLTRKVNQGLAEISLVDQSQLWPNSQLPSPDLGPYKNLCSSHSLLHGTYSQGTRSKTK